MPETQSSPPKTNTLLASSLLIAVVGVFMMHTAAGADPLIVSVVMLTVSIGLIPVWQCNFFNIGALLILLVSFRYVGFPLIGKLVFLQPIDSNLAQPLGSTLAILTGLVSYVVGFLLVNKLNLKRSILEPTTDSFRLRRISVFAAIIGCTANLAVALHAGRDYTGITIANFFVPFLHLALIASVASELCRTNGLRCWNFLVLALIITEIVFALVRNSRMAIVETVLCLVITISAFQGKVRWLRIGFYSIMIFLIVVIITPIMLYVRNARSDLTWTQRISATVMVISDWRTALDSYKRIQQHQTREGFFLNYYGSPQNVLERMSMINHVDVLKDATDKHDHVGFQDLKVAVYSALPRVIAPDKPVGSSQGDWLYCEANVACFDGGYSTVPLIANGYAAFGWFGCFLYPLLMGSLILLIVKLISGFDIKRNIWALYLFMRLHNCFAEGDSASYIQNVLRDLPQDLAILIPLSIIVQIEFFRPHGKGLSKKIL